MRSSKIKEPELSFGGIILKYNKKKCLEAIIELEDVVLKVNNDKLKKFLREIEENNNYLDGKNK